MNKTYTFKEYVQLAFCENGVPSSKRIVGTFVICFVLLIMLVSLIRDGVTPFLETMCQTMAVGGFSLIGLKTFTSIFKHEDKEIQVSAGKDEE